MVRREAEVGINNIIQWIYEWLDEPPKIVYKIREDVDDLQEQTVQGRQNHIKLHSFLNLSHKGGCTRLITYISISSKENIISKHCNDELKVVCN